MKGTSLLRFLLLLLTSTYFVAAQTKAVPATTYRITGTLINGSDGSPVAHGHLTATLVSRASTLERHFPAPVGTFDADPHGHFSIDLPSAGMWRLMASAHGYVSQAYDEHELFSSGIVLTAAAPMLDIQFRISPEAAITGRVLDEAGEAVRNARVSLLAVPPIGPDSVQPPARTRGTTSTDDRGTYEFDELPPGDYRLSVQAQVWYAVAAQSRRSDQPALDSSLDVVYPLTWYPGTSDPTSVESITLHAGDIHQADFQLTPIPSVHLHILPDTSATLNGQGVQSYPMIERISPDSRGGFVPVSVHKDAQGAMDVSGLAPGKYEIRMQERGQMATPAFIDVTTGSVQTLDMNATAMVANVTVHMDGIDENEARSVHVNLIDPETGRDVAGGGRRGSFVLSGALLHRREEAADQVMEVPPGRYKVVLEDQPNLYLSGIKAQSAQVSGRFVTLPSGNSTLTLHVSTGRAALTGVATIQGKPSVGAMVLLIPTTLGDPDGLSIIRRDQTNTDGSFDLNEVLPGQYILVAIDHGWQVNWRDPSTLRGYMMHGVPIDLAAAAKLKQDIEAQLP